MKKIYQQFDSATSNVSAYALIKNGDYKGRIVIKYPKDGAGRLYAYVQEWGHVMVRGYAGGCGYDKVGAAIQSCYQAALKEFGDDIPDLFKALEHTTYNGQWQKDLEKGLEKNGYDILNVI